MATKSSLWVAKLVSIGVDYMSYRLKLHGGGIISFSFIISKLAGDNGITLVGSLSVLTLSDWDFTMAFTFVIMIWSNLLFRQVSWFLSTELRILLHERIWLSKASSIWLAAGGFLKNLTQLVRNLARKKSNFYIIHFRKRIFQFVVTHIKFVPLSHLM